MKTIKWAALAMLLVGCDTRFNYGVQPNPRKAPDEKAENPLVYAYGTPAFTAFVARSFREAKSGDSVDLYNHLDSELKTARGQTWTDLIKRHREELDKKAVTQRAVGDDVWKAVKQTIRKFSLDRGFEYANIVRTGERQCLAQSVLVSGTLQAIGLKAGCAMVWKNPQGNTSNLGHVTAILRLSDNRDIIIDASDPVPTVRHQGLFLYSLVDKAYLFVEPVFGTQDAITGYRRMDGSLLRVNQTRFLSSYYLKSQFDYYRGERAPGGLIAKPMTKEGLADSIRHLRAAVEMQNDNPLAVFMLGRALALHGERKEANEWYEKARMLYRRSGWMPGAVLEAKS